MAGVKFEDFEQYSAPRARFEDFELSDPSSKKSFKDMFVEAYGPLEAQQRRQRETEARGNVPQVGATLGLGALEEVSKWAPNILSTVGINLPRPEGGFMQFSPMEDKEIAEEVGSIGALLPHGAAVGRVLGSSLVSNIGSKSFIPGMLGEGAKMGLLEMLLADPGSKKEAAVGGAAGGAATYAAGTLLSRLIHGKSKTPIESKTERLQRAREAEASLKEQKIQSEQSIKDTNLKNAERLANESIVRQRNIEDIKSRLAERLPKTEQENIGALTKSMTNAREEIKTAYKGMYDNFRDQVGKVTEVKNPISLKDAQSVLKDKSIPSDLRSRLQRIVGKEEVTPAYIDAATMIPHSERTTLKAPTGTNVSDYLEAHKRFLSEGHRYNEAAKAYGLSLAEADKLRATAKKYFKTAKMLDDSIVGSISPAQQAEYQSIKDFFIKYEIPFRSSPMLKSSVSRDPQIKQQDFFSSLTRENKPDLRARLLRDNSVREAIAKHDLMDLDLSDLRKIEKTLSGDRGASLPTDIRQSLEKLQSRTAEKADLDKVLQTVGAEELAFLKKYPEMEGIFARRPELRRPFDEVQREAKRLDNIKNELIRAGMERQQAEIALREYKQKIRGVGGILSTIFGSKVYFGSKGLANMLSPSSP